MQTGPRSLQGLVVPSAACLCSWGRPGMSEMQVRECIAGMRAHVSLGAHIAQHACAARAAPISLTGARREQQRADYGCCISR